MMANGDFFLNFTHDVRTSRKNVKNKKQNLPLTQKKCTSNWLSNADGRKLTHGFHCHLDDAHFAGQGDDDGLDLDDDASFVEILSEESSHACGLCCDGHTFQIQTFDASGIQVRM